MSDSDSFCWEFEVQFNTNTGHASITNKKNRILIVDLTSEDSDQDVKEEIKESLSPAATVDLTYEECDATCQLTSATTCQDIPIIDLTEEANTPVIDLTGEDCNISDIIPQSDSKVQPWKLIEWEPRDLDSPRSPLYKCNRVAAYDIPNGYNGYYNHNGYNGYNGHNGYAVPYYDHQHDHDYAQLAGDGPRSPSPPSSPASQDTIDVVGYYNHNGYNGYNGHNGYAVPYYDHQHDHDYAQLAGDGPRSTSPPSSPASQDTIDVVDAIDIVQHHDGPSSPLSDTNGNVQPHIDVPSIDEAEAGPSGWVPQPDVDDRSSSSSSVPVEYINVGDPLFDVGSPSYTPGSPLYDPLAPDNNDDSTSSSFNDFHLVFSASWERED